MRQDVIFEIIETNVRLPKMSLGDLNAELASVRIAEARLEEITQKYGVDRLIESFQHILSTSERLSRAAIAAMPDGTYTAEDWVDGDGISNLQEFLAGTDPTDSASSFRITSIAQVGTNILVTWMMGSGKTNALQVTTGSPGGSYSSNNFVDIFTVTNTVGSITNYLDIGAATNSPSRYYRVHVVP